MNSYLLVDSFNPQSPEQIFNTVIVTERIESIVETDNQEGCAIQMFSGTVHFVTNSLHDVLGYLRELVGE